jgi:hypothetical protein
VLVLVAPETGNELWKRGRARFAAVTRRELVTAGFAPALLKQETPGRSQPLSASPFIVLSCAVPPTGLRLPAEEDARVVILAEGVEGYLGIIC